MTTQHSLFDDPDRLVTAHELRSLRAQVADLQQQLARLQKPKRAATLTAADNKRLNEQTVAILNRLRRGPATNAELAEVALKYTSRVSDARAAGYRIDCERIGDGLTRYTLVGEVEP